MRATALRIALLSIAVGIAASLGAAFGAWLAALCLPLIPDPAIFVIGAPRQLLDTGLPAAIVGAVLFSFVAVARPQLLRVAVSLGGLLAIMVVTFGLAAIVCPLIAPSLPCVI